MYKNAIILPDNSSGSVITLLPSSIDLKTLISFDESVA